MIYGIFLLLQIISSIGQICQQRNLLILMCVFVLGCCMVCQMSQLIVPPKTIYLLRLIILTRFHLQNNSNTYII